MSVVGSRNYKNIVAVTISLRTVDYNFNKILHTVTTTTTTVLWPFVHDYPGEPVPEETLTHPPS